MNKLNKMKIMNLTLNRKVELNNQKKKFQKKTHIFNNYNKNQKKLKATFYKKNLISLKFLRKF